MNVHFQSNSNEWSTPQELFGKLNKEFGFTLDAAASDANAKCENYFTQQDNGLIQSWNNHRVFCNPPYGREIGKWIAKAATEQNELTVMLIPARTDTKAWHKFIFGNAEIRFIEGRLKFNDHKNHAPFPSAIVIFRNKRLDEHTVNQVNSPHGQPR